MSVKNLPVLLSGHRLTIVDPPCPKTKDDGNGGQVVVTDRHTGNHLAARTGATTKDLMSRMRHDDMRAALIYQHATAEADQRIAERLSGLVDDHRRAGLDDV
jgi:hypothetical protein